MRAKEVMGVDVVVRCRDELCVLCVVCNELTYRVCLLLTHSTLSLELFIVIPLAVLFSFVLFLEDLFLN